MTFEERVMAALEKTNKLGPRFRTFIPRLLEQTDDLRLQSYQVDLGRYRDYTPVLSATTTPPNLGTGATATARYTQIGKFIHCYGKFVFGSAPSAGSGVYLISVPVLGRTNADSVVASARLFDSSAGFMATPTMWLGFVSGVQWFALGYPAVWPAGLSTNVADNAPWVWAQSDEINFEALYEAA